MDRGLKQFIEGYLVAGSGPRGEHAIDSEKAENGGQHVLTCFLKNCTTPRVGLMVYVNDIG
jgi:hypothetical protein